MRKSSLGLGNSKVQSESLPVGVEGRRLPRR